MFEYFEMFVLCSKHLLLSITLWTQWLIPTGRNGDCSISLVQLVRSVFNEPWESDKLGFDLREDFILKATVPHCWNNSHFLLRTYPKSLPGMSVTQGQYFNWVQFSFFYTDCLTNATETARLFTNSNGNVFTQPLQDKQYVTQSQNLNGLQLIWIQSFPSSILVAKPRQQIKSALLFSHSWGSVFTQPLCHKQDVTEGYFQMEYSWFELIVFLLYWSPNQGYRRKYALLFICSLSGREEKMVSYLNAKWNAKIWTRVDGSISNEDICDTMRDFTLRYSLTVSSIELEYAALPNAGIELITARLIDTLWTKNSCCIAT